MNLLLRILWLLLLSAYPWAASAADSCRPLRVLQEGSVVALDPAQTGADPVIEATLDADLVLQQDAGGLGRPAGASSWTTSEAITAKAQVLLKAVFRSPSVDLMFDREMSGPAVLVHEGQRYLTYPSAGRALNAYGKPLRVRPLQAASRSFTLRSGARLSIDGTGRVVVGKGAVLRWQLGNNADFEFLLAEPTTLEATRPAGLADVDVTVIKPSRLLPGAVLKLQLRGTGFDFRNKPLVFCFAAMPEGASGIYTFSAPGRLMSESSDGALFEVRVPAGMSNAGFKAIPGQAVASDAQAGAWLGNFASVRVIGLDGNKIVFDASQAFVTSNFWLSFGAGFALIAVLGLVGMVLFGERDPRKLVARFVRHPTQRFSLSNFQIMLWTLLVLYAFCFVWIANGILLDISSGVLVLLGISGGTSVLARGIEHMHGAADRPAVDQARYRDLVTDENGEVDLLRFQMLGFTLFTVAYSFVSVIRSEGLPDIPDNLYLLMGISSGTYIGGKLSDSFKPPADASRAAFPAYEQQMANEDIRGLQRGVAAPETGVLDAATREAVIASKLGYGIVPADGSVNQLFVERLKADKRIA